MYGRQFRKGARIELEATVSPVCVELTIPCSAEYVGVARLAVLGIANRMRFSFEEIEDLKLAVSEACTTSVEWAKRNNAEGSYITLKSEITSDQLTIWLTDEAGERTLDEESDSTPDAWRPLLITLLLDEVTVEPTKTGTKVRMVKHAQHH